MNPKWQEIGKLIKLNRMGRGLSQLEAAKKLAISPSLLTMYEKGQRRPPLEFAFKFEHLFEIAEAPISTLIIGEDYEHGTGQRWVGQKAGAGTFISGGVKRPERSPGEVWSVKREGEGTVIPVKVKMLEDVYLRLQFE